MMSLREQAIELVKTLPDNQIVNVIDVLKDIKGLLEKEITDDSQYTLLEEIKELRGIVHSDIDEKVELAQAKDEKYACFG